MQVNTMYIMPPEVHPQKEEGEKRRIKDAPIGIYVYPTFQAHLVAQVCADIKQNQFYFVVVFV